MVNLLIYLAVTYCNIPIKLDDSGDIIARSTFNIVDLNVNVITNCIMAIIMKASFFYLIKIYDSNSVIPETS